MTMRHLPNREEILFWVEKNRKRDMILLAIVVFFSIYGLVRAAIDIARYWF